MTNQRVAAFGMFGLGVGYLLWYAPYSALAKAISGGMIPGIDQTVGGLVLLPATVVGQLLAMPVFVLASGWWRYAGRRRIGGLSVPFPGRYTLESAFWMALIIGTTTLNFTFPDASIVFMLVLMRISTLLIAPTIDLVRRARIHWYSATAVGLALVSAFIALADAGNYTLTFGAILSLAMYATGYTLRFRIMGKQAKKGVRTTDRRYFIEEHMAAPVVLLILVAVPAVIGLGSWMQALRMGFGLFLSTPEVVLPAMLIGVCYEGLFIMTTLIYLDRREFSFGMPVHVCSSLLAGIVASIGLNALLQAPLPSVAQYVSAGIVIVAAFLLSYPMVMGRIAARRRARLALVPRPLLFICGGNTSRSPMAAAIAHAELAAMDGGVRWPVRSAGLTVHEPGAPMSPEAVRALVELGVEAPLGHESRQLTPDQCAGTEMVYCMTRAQRDAVLALVPDAAERTICLDPEYDVPDPAGQPFEAYLDCAVRLRSLVRDRLQEQRERYALS
ncbi:MAG: hypothetical protein GEV11_11370 [Streptosporangiales bacterium]|nr:hypothetical protein [Streptosporangiales bacterium]